MGESKRHMFLGSCFPIVLKKLFSAATPPEQLAVCLQTSHRFATAFLPSDPDDETGRVVKSMASGFLYKLLVKALPLVIRAEGLAFSPIEAAGGADDEGQSCKRARAALEAAEGEVNVRGPAASSPELQALCVVARDAAATSPRGILASLEEMDTGDPTGDGGGDLEVSPLCHAAFAYLLEQPNCWREMQPHVLPVVLSPVRRLNVILR